MDNSMDLNDDEPDRNKDNPQMDKHDNDVLEVVLDELFKNQNPPPNVDEPDQNKEDDQNNSKDKTPDNDGRVADSIKSITTNKKTLNPEEIFRDRIKPAPLYLSMYFERNILYKQISCHKIYKTLLDYGGEPLKVMNQSKNALLIKCKNAKQSIEYQKINKIENEDINVKPHPTLNYCKGKIYAPELAASTIEELKEDLSAQGVTYIYRIKRKSDDSNELVDTNSFILTFNSPILPFSVKISYLNIEVKPYVDYPRRCQICLLYGHGKTKCRTQTPRCYKCGQNKTEHHVDPCILPRKCFHCGLDHVVSYKGCQRFKMETEIIHVAQSNKVPLLEASKMVKASGRFSGMTYADATKQLPSRAPERSQPLMKNVMNTPINNIFDCLKDNVTTNNDNNLTKNTLVSRMTPKPNEKNLTNTPRQEKTTRLTSQNLNSSNGENKNITFKRERSTTNITLPNSKIHRSQEAGPSTENTGQTKGTPSLLDDFPMPPDYNSYKNSKGNYHKPNTNLHKKKSYSVTDFKRTGSPPRDPRLKSKTGQPIKTVIGSTPQRNPNL